jgi:CDGSH-type Zn-finger protein/uncharacterized Fe-S cluster protein YjdI
MNDRAEPLIRVATREDVLTLLAEAAAIEHNLMCCYLYAAFSLKTADDDGITAETGAMLQRWRNAIRAVAMEEMTHLTLVANLTCAVGGRPNFARPNFPVVAGFHPAGVVVRLAPFTMDTLDHFIFLERPESSDIADSASFSTGPKFHRAVAVQGVMPNSQDFETVGHLYRGIRNGLDLLAQTMGERMLFCGTIEHQVGPGTVSLPGLRTVSDLAGAHAAIDTIVDQGEGASTHREDSHFARFLTIKAEYQEALRRDPLFAPGRPVADNPVMRAPLSGTADRVFVNEPLAARTLDFVNGLYGQMLRFLVQAFGRARPSAADQILLTDGAAAMMRYVAPIAEALTRMPANASRAGINAGMTFTMIRDLAPTIEGPTEWSIMAERVEELARAARELAPQVEEIAAVAPELGRLATALVARGKVARVETKAAESNALRPSASSEPAASEAVAVASVIEDGIEIASSPGVTIKYETKRCIHARFCMLWQPQVYKANVKGPWINPAGDSVEAVVAVAHNCPSGAIRYERHDGKPDEQAPAVNVIYLRENGPLAVRAEILLAGRPIGYRVTFCRCGASKNKPFCDNSHNEIGFAASGEPKTVDATSLAARDGAVEFAPARNGPLRVRGNLEICCGTGRIVKRTTGEALCRCGHSQNKPFCDGSHARVGFVAD